MEYGVLMGHLELATDHVRRAQIRLRALDALYEAESWADVVCESEEVVELTLHGLLHAVGIDPPRVHVADVLEAQRNQLPNGLAKDLDRLAAVARNLRRDRELAFLGAPDLVPSEFYRKADAREAREAARFVVASVTPRVE